MFKEIKGSQTGMCAQLQIISFSTSIAYGGSTVVADIADAYKYNTEAVVG